MNNNDSENKYGFKLDGTPKKAPGRKPGNKSVGQVFYVHNGARLKAGKPSLTVLQERRRVVLGANETYDPTVHLGERDPEDDKRVQDRIEDAKFRLEQKAEKKAAAKSINVPANESAETVRA